MCGGGSNTTSTTSSPPAAVTQAYTDTYNQAKGVAGQPLQQYSGAMVAGFTPDQLASFGAVRDAQGLAQPYISQGANYIQEAANPLTADKIQSLASPYTQDVVAKTQDWYNHTNKQGIENTAGNATTRGAYGGDREAVAEALTSEGQNLAQAPVIAGLYDKGYGQAVQAAEAQGWLRQGAGYGLSSLGKTAQDESLSGASALYGTGTDQQKLEQAKLNIPYEQFTQQQAFPYQTTGWLSNIAQGIGSGMGGTSSTTAPGASTLGQVAGLGVAGTGVLGATGAFGSNGWLTGSSGGPTVNDLIGTGSGYAGFLSNRGGRIPHRAPGGSLGDMPDYSVPDVSISYIPSQTSGTARGTGALAFQPTTTTTSKSGGGGGGILGLLGTVGGSFVGMPWLGAVGSGLDRVTGVHRGGGVGYAPGGSTPIPDIALPMTGRYADIIPASIESTHSVENYAPQWQARGSYPAPMVPVHSDYAAQPLAIGWDGGMTTGRLQRLDLSASPAVSAPQIVSAPMDLGSAPNSVDNASVTGDALTNQLEALANNSSGGDSGGNRGGRIERDLGGTVPDLSRSYIPTETQQQKRSGLGIPPPPKPYQSDPMKEGESIANLASQAGKLFRSSDDHSFGGVVYPEMAGQNFDYGGGVQEAGQGMSGGYNQMASGLVQQYMQLPIEKLRELAMRPSQNTSQTQAIQQAIRIKMMNPATGGQQTASLGTPTSAVSPSLAWQGGFQKKRDDGGPVAPIQPMSLADKLRRINQLTADRWAAERGERAAGSPVSSFSSLAARGYADGGDTEDILRDHALDPTLGDPLPTGDAATIATPVATVGMGGSGLDPGTATDDRSANLGYSPPPNPEPSSVSSPPPPDALPPADLSGQPPSDLNPAGGVPNAAPQLHGTGAVPVAVSPEAKAATAEAGVAAPAPQAKIPPVAALVDQVIPQDQANTQAALGFKAVLPIENNLWNPKQYGAMTRFGERAIGPAQIMPSTGRRYGYTPEQLLDNKTNLEAGYKIFSDMLQKSGGDLNKAWAMYYGAPDSRYLTPANANFAMLSKGMSLADLAGQKFTGTPDRREEARLTPTGDPDQMVGQQPGDLGATPAAMTGDASKADLSSMMDQIHGLRNGEPRNSLYQNQWMPLVAAGLGMMASRNPRALGAIGEGGLTGLKAMQGQETAAQKDALTEVRSQALEAQAQNMLLKATQAQEMIDLKTKAGQDTLTLKREQLKDLSTYRDAKIAAEQAKEEERKRHAQETEANTARLRTVQEDRAATEKQYRQVLANRYDSKFGHEDPNNESSKLGTWYIPRFVNPNDPESGKPIFKPGGAPNMTGKESATVNLVGELKRDNPGMKTSEALLIVRDPAGKNAQTIKMSMERLIQSAAKSDVASDLTGKTKLEPRVEHWRQVYTGVLGNGATLPLGQSTTATGTTGQQQPQTAPTEIVQNGVRYKLENGKYTPVERVQ